jgi:hypothetical protein
MGVFIGWSGKNTKSYLVAVALRSWLEETIQGCEPWVSTQDIDAGDRWGTELFSQLDKHKVGIICVTKENQDQPWVNFEAGALAKQFKGDQQDESRVCPLLIGMTINYVTGPLKMLQTMPLGEEGIFKVLRMVNKSMPKPLSDETLKSGFDKWWWPDLQERLEEMQVPEQQPVKSSRTAEEILDEILSIVRSIDKATNRSALADLTNIFSSPGIAGFTPAGVPIWPPTYGVLASSMETLNDSRKEELASEVRKTDSALAQVISAGTASSDGDTLTITLRHLVMEERLETAKKAAAHLGYKVHFRFQGNASQ